MEITRRLSVLFLDMSSNARVASPFLAAPSPLTLALSCDGRHAERGRKKKALLQHYPEKHRGGRGTLVDILPIAQQNQRKGRKEGEKKRNVIFSPLKNRRKHTE